MKYIFGVFALIFVLLIAFQMIPTGSDSQTIINEYMSTESIQTSRIPLQTKAQLEQAKQSAVRSGSPMELTFPVKYDGTHLYITSIVGSHEKGIHDSGHAGTDIAPGGDSSPPLNIVSATDGKIITLDEKNDNACGAHVVILQESSGYRFIYCHMRVSSIPASLKLGSAISAGEMIGIMGDTGDSTAEHLHFGILLPGAPYALDSSAYKGLYLSALNSKKFVYNKSTVPPTDMLSWAANESSELPLSTK